MNINIEKFEEILSALDETVIIFSTSGDYIKVFNEASSGEDFGVADFIGKNIAETIASETADIFISKIREAASTGETQICEYQISNISFVGCGSDDGESSTIFYRAKVKPLLDNGEVCCVAWIAYDLTELKTMEMKLQNSAMEDPATGVYNRRFFFKELNNFFQRFLRGSNSYSIIMINLDHSEKLSDTYGLEITEKMVVSFIGIIKGALRTTDLFASTGNEDFIVLLPDTPSNGASMMGERLRNAIANHIFEMEGAQYNVTASFGCSEVSEHDSSYDNVINRAEIALYQAKHNGGNAVKRLNYENWNKKL